MDQLILTILDGYNHVSTIYFSINYILISTFKLKLIVAQHNCPVAGKVVGKKQIEKFLSRNCRIATQSEVTNAGYAYTEALEGENWYFLKYCPGKKITIPNMKGEHLLLGKWSSGMIFLEGWIM